MTTVNAEVKSPERHVLTHWARFTTSSSPSYSTSNGNGRTVDTVARTAHGKYRLTLVQSCHLVCASANVKEDTNASAKVLAVSEASSSFSTIDVGTLVNTNRAPTAWSSSLTVSSHTCDAPDLGYVVAVEATAGSGGLGPCEIISTGTPGAGQVKVEYTGGLATLTFHTASAITGAVLTMVPTFDAAWITGEAVSSHTVTLSTQGAVIAVDATTGSTTGHMDIISTGTPATGEVLVEYTDGVATLTFATADAVTETSAKVLPTPELLPGWRTVAVSSHVHTFDEPHHIVAVEGLAGSSAGVKELQTGTPGAGEVLVEYVDGIPRLTFATADAITSAAVLAVPTGNGVFADVSDGDGGAEVEVLTKVTTSSRRGLA